MKKTITLCLSFMMIFVLAACGSQTDENGDLADRRNNEAQTDGTQTDGAQTDGTQTDGTQTDGSADNTQTTAGKTLVVYYSATGSTETAANYIASATNGDLFELEPVDPYTNADLDWTDDDSRVSYEHDNPDERTVELIASTVPDWESYDTVFIGYPIWWGIAAWPVDEFISANDFTGKTVIPFCTSSTSGLGESGDLLEQAAGTGDWLEGMRFSSRVSETDVQNWIADLGLAD